jgi:hypothetical protein
MFTCVATALQETFHARSFDLWRYRTIPDKLPRRSFAIRHATRCTTVWILHETVQAKAISALYSEITSFFWKPSNEVVVIVL